MQKQWFIQIEERGKYFIFVWLKLLKKNDKNEKKKQRVYSKKRLVEPESNTGRKTEQSKIQQQQQQFRVKDQHGRRLQGRRRRSDVVKRIVSTTQVQRTASFQS